MLKYIFFFFLFVSCKSTKDHKSDTLNFVDYSDFELELSNHQDLEKINQKFNLIFIFLLDSAKLDSFYEYDPELKDLVSHYSNGLGLNNSTVGFSTNETSIKNIFLNNFSNKMIFDCIFGEERQQLDPKIKGPIYINKNVAIFEILTQVSIGIYSCILLNGVMQINYLGSTIE